MKTGQALQTKRQGKRVRPQKTMSISSSMPTPLKQDTGRHGRHERQGNAFFVCKAMQPKNLQTHETGQASQIRKAGKHPPFQIEKKSHKASNKTIFGTNKCHITRHEGQTSKRSLLSSSSSHRSDRVLMATAAHRVLVCLTAALDVCADPWRRMQ